VKWQVRVSDRMKKSPKRATTPQLSGPCESHCIQVSDVNIGMVPSAMSHNAPFMPGGHSQCPRQIKANSTINIYKFLAFQRHHNQKIT